MSKTLKSKSSVYDQAWHRAITARSMHIDGDFQCSCKTSGVPDPTLEFFRIVGSGNTIAVFPDNTFMIIDSGGQNG